MHASLSLHAGAPRWQPKALGVIVLAHGAVLWSLSGPTLPVTPPQVPAMTMVSVVSALPKSQRPPSPVPAVARAPAPTVLGGTAPAAIQVPSASQPVALSDQDDAPSTAVSSMASQSPGVATAHAVTASAAQGPSAQAQPGAAAISAPRFDAAYLDNPRPAYPPLSRKANEQGRVLLRVSVDASGAAREVAVHATSGFERLDRAAVAAVSRWRFVPARQGSEAVAAAVLVPIVFSFKD